MRPTPFFEYGEEKSASPNHVGFFPIRANSDPLDNVYRMEPAKLTGGVISIRRDSQRFFGDTGIEAVEETIWGMHANAGNAGE